MSHLARPLLRPADSSVVSVAESPSVLGRPLSPETSSQSRITSSVLLVQYSLDIPEENSLDIPGENSLDIPGENSLDIPGENSLDIPGENSLDIPGENSLDIPGENSLDIPGENSLDIPGENSLDIPGENSLDIPGENSLDIPGENSLDIPGENSLETRLSVCRSCRSQHERNSTMTHISLTDCCRLLNIDPKTLRRWLDLAHLSLLPHPTDARIKGITTEQLRHVATVHRRWLADFPEAVSLSVPLSPPPEPPPLSGKLTDVLQTISELSAQIVVLQQRLADLTQLLHPVPVLASPAQEESVTIVAEPAPTAMEAKPVPVPATSSSRSATSCSAERLPRTRSRLTADRVWYGWGLRYHLS